MPPLEEVKKEAPYQNAPISIRNIGSAFSAKPSSIPARSFRPLRSGVDSLKNSSNNEASNGSKSRFVPNVGNATSSSDEADSFKAKLEKHDKHDLYASGGQSDKNLQLPKLNFQRDALSHSSKSASDSLSILPIAGAASSLWNNKANASSMSIRKPFHHGYNRVFQNPRDSSEFKKKSKSKVLLELSWPDESELEYLNYPPITLPFIVREESSQPQVNEGNATQNRQKESKRPTVKFVDEANRGVAVFFRDIIDSSSCSDANDEAATPSLLHLQFPLYLPSLDKESIVSQFDHLEEKEGSKDSQPKQNSSLSPTKSILRKEAHIASKEAKTSKPIGKTDEPMKLEDLPDGRLGKLLVFKSGKMKLQLGKEIFFDVNYGSECNFWQEVGCIVEGSSEFIFVGQCHKRMIMTPEIERPLINQSIDAPMN